MIGSLPKSPPNVMDWPDTRRLSTRLLSHLGRPPVTGKAADPGIDEAIVHLLSRTSFGVSAAELEAARGAGAEAWLEYQLDAEAIDDSALENILADALPTLRMSYREIFEQLRSDQQINTAGELIIATIARQLFSPRQLYEVMVEFWSNHFNVFLLDGPVQYLKTVDDRDNIRPHALGRFRDLLRANARSPAMLIYLDNAFNTSEGPNENYARELMELHTLGVDGGYDEGDVKQVARAFTGWTLSEQEEDLFVFEPALHDFEGKSVLGTLLPAGQGIEDGEMVLDILADHPSTAHFLSTKLCRRFISDDPPDSAVDAVAACYLETDGDIRAMLEVLLTSPEFNAARDAKFRRPAEYTASVMRALAPQMDGDFLRVIFAELERQGQIPFFAVPPTGYGDDADTWLNSNALLSRWNLGFAVAFGEVQVSERRDLFDESDGAPLAMADLLTLPIFSLLGDARTPAEIVDRLVAEVLHRTIDVVDRRRLIDYARGDGPSTVPLGLKDAVARARGVLAALLSSRYFQYR